MKTMTIEIPDGKEAKWVNNVLSFVDEQPVEFKFKVGDKVYIKGDLGVYTITGQLVQGNIIYYALQGRNGGFQEAELEPYTQPKDITERIKTFEDACEWCKENGKQGLYEQYADALNVGLQRAKDILAYLKLRIITCALNEGWKPTFEEGEKKWYCYYNDNFDLTANPVYENNTLFYPKALCFKFRKLAEYAATQFKDIYMDFCYKGKEGKA